MPTDGDGGRPVPTAAVGATRRSWLPGLERPDDAVLSAQLLADEVLARGYEVRWVHRACFLTQVDGRPVGFWCARTDLVSAVAEHLTTRKDLTTRVLEGHRVPTIKTWPHRTDERELAWQEHREEGVLVVKPARGSRGRGVTVGVTDLGAFTDAWASATAIDPDWVLVQPQVRGHEVRCLVVQNRVVAAAVKRPPELTGDGTHTIEELIASINHRRRANRHLAELPLVIDERRLKRLRDDGYGPTTVLPRGRRVVLDDSAALTHGGTSHDVTTQLHAAHRSLAVRTAKCFPGLGIAGVDLVVEHVDAPSNSLVLEVNSMPGLGIHHFPYEGHAYPAARAVVEATLSSAVRTAGQVTG